MSEHEGKKLVLTDSGTWVRIFGIIALVGSQGFFHSSFTGSSKQTFELGGWVCVIIGLGMLLFASDLTITADRSTRILQLKYRYWWLFDMTREIPFDDIADVRAVKDTSTSHGHTSTGYQLVAVLKDGKKVPFRWYSFTDSGKIKQATRLRTAIGLTHKRSTSSVGELPDVAVEADEGLEKN